MDRYDAIVVGGGHNGLVAGAYLAKAGARSVILEARHKAGVPRPRTDRGRTRRSIRSPRSAT